MFFCLFPQGMIDGDVKVALKNWDKLKVTNANYPYILYLFCY